jgi:hypothetical protein
MLQALARWVAPIPQLFRDHPLEVVEIAVQHFTREFLLRP